MYSQPLGEGGGARPIVKEDGLAFRLLLKPMAGISRLTAEYVVTQSSRCHNGPPHDNHSATDNECHVRICRFRRLADSFRSAINAMS